MSEERSKFREELQKYKELVSASPISSRYDTEPSRPTSNSKSVQKGLLSAKLTLASSETAKGSRSERWFQRYPASVLDRFKGREPHGLFAATEGKREGKPTKGSEANSELEAPTPRVETGKAEGSNAHLVIAQQRDEIARLTALLSHSKTEVARLQRENAALRAQLVAPPPGLLATLTEQLRLGPAPAAPCETKEDRPMRRTNNLH